jgi:hypothetical protein
MAISTVAIISRKAVAASGIEARADYTSKFRNGLTIDETSLEQSLNSWTTTNLLVRDMKTSPDIPRDEGSLVDTVILQDLISIEFGAAGRTGIFFSSPAAASYPYISKARPILWAKSLLQCAARP